MPDTDKRYPLSWPISWPRAKGRERARFGKKVDRGNWQSTEQLSVYDAVRRLNLELDRLGAAAIIISTNVQLRQDGLPRSDRGEPTDPGAAIYFKLKGRDTVLACDKWDRVADNLNALAKHIEAVRGQARWGVGTVEQSFRGYEALPAPEQPWQVLGIEPDASREEISAAYRALAKEATNRGSEAMMSRLNVARDSMIAVVTNDGGR